MNLTLYGSQLSKDKTKTTPYSNSSVNDLGSKTKDKPNSVNTNSKSKYNPSNLSSQTSEGKHRGKYSIFKCTENDSARTKSTIKSGSIKSTKTSGRMTSNQTPKTRLTTLDTFLNLQSNDYSDRDGVEKWLKDQSIKDWEEISISSHKNSSKLDNDSKDVLIIPINKNAFESQNYSQNFNEDNESSWGASERTLSPVYFVETNRTSRSQQAKETLKEMERKEKAAKIIQSWFRRHLKRRRLAEAAMRRMLTNKQTELKQQLSSVEQIESSRKHIFSTRNSLISKSSKINTPTKADDSVSNRKKSLDKEIAEKEVEKLKLENRISSRPSSSRTLSSRSKNSTGNQNKSLKSPLSKSNSDIKSKYLNNDESETSQSLNESKRLIQEKIDRDLEVKSIIPPSEVTTIDDILSTIKELESVDCLTDRSGYMDKKSQLHNKSGWSAITEDIDKLLKPEEFKTISNLHINSNDQRLTSNILKMHNNNMNNYQSKSEMNLLLDKPIQSTISDAKMNSILHFLNTSEIVDNISDLETKPTRDLPEKEWTIFDVKELEENTQTAVHEVSTKVMTLKLELEEKQRSIEMLQKALQQQRELTIRQVKETQKDMEKRIDCQKEEYESALQRNHTFIDQLISKNELLQDKCNKLVLEIKEKTQKYEEKIKNITENNNVELKKVEAKHTAAEKIRRDKWEAEKTKLIKEMTIKGMESEIAQLIANHKQEMRKMKQYYENEIVTAGENSYEKYNRQVEELRKQMYKEKEEACQKEHDILKERFDQEMQRQIHILESQRKQLYQEISDERDRLTLLGNKQKSEIEKLRQQVEHKEDKVGESMKLQHQHAMDEMQRKFENEIRELKTQVELEKHIWVETQNKKNEAWLLSREQEIKNDMKRTRDQEIEKVIQQLEDDSTQSKQDIETSNNNKLKRAKDKYEAEINELELSEKQAKEKYNQIRAEYSELEGDHESLKVMIRQKEKEVDDVKQLYETLSREREHVSDIIRQEFADRLVATEEENRKLKRDISELRAKVNLLQLNHNEEMERIQLNHQSDITEVHNKVKEAIKRKEENMNELRNQFQTETGQWQQKLAAAENRSKHLESLLEQQRKHLLKLK